MSTRRHRERLDDDQTTASPSPTKRRIRLRLDADDVAASKPRTSDHLTLLDAFSDPKLFAKFFPDPHSWIAWTALIAAAFGLDMNAEQLAIYRKCTGRNEPPTEQMRELVLVVGRRGGKSRVLALIATWLAAFVDYRAYLDAGERGVVQILAADRDQAKIILRYVKAFFKLPMLAKLVEREHQWGLDLSNNVAIEITTASFRSVRGRTVVAALADEIAFWNDEGANPDSEVVKAIRPAMATIPNAMLILASSPYSRKGVLWDMHRQYYGKDDPRVLAWQASTETMNPAIDAKWLAEQYEADPVSASAEYGSQFRTDVSAFIAPEAVDAVTSDERERPYIAGKRYHGFADPAGGSGKDSFTLAIGHVEDRIPTLDVIREWKPPFSPRVVIEQCSDLLKQYGVRKLTADRFAAGEFAVEAFREHQITLEHSLKPKSQIYSEFLPLLNSKTCDLLDNPRLRTQLIGLERRVARSGKDSIDHGPGGHDDVANSVAGVLTSMGVRRYRYDATLSWVIGTEQSSSNQQSPAAQQLSALVQVQTMKGFLR